MMDVESIPAAETDFPVKNEQPHQQTGSGHSGYARLIAMFERLARRDQQEIVAIARQKLHLRQLLSDYPEERGNEFLRDE